ncbi:hypothetical protein ACYX34_02035 [Nitrospira sp. CMX1]
MMTRHDLAELGCYRESFRREVRSGFGLPPLYAPRYNAPFIAGEE